MSSNSNIWTLQPTTNNWLEKLNEWATKFKASVDWEETESKTKSGDTEWDVTPIVRGVRMADCTGHGSTKQEAKNSAAEQLSGKGRLQTR